MRRQLLIACLVLLFSLTIVLAVNNLTREQRDFYNDCKKNCSTTKMLEKRECNTAAFACRDTCREIRLNCTANYSSVKENCIAACNNLNITGNLTEDEVEKIKEDCEKNCSAEAKDSRKICNENRINCNRACQNNKNECKKTANENAWLCKENCIELAYQYGVNQTNDSNTTSGNETNSSEADLEKIFCPRTRPTSCTGEYDPICSNRNATYDNACIACKDRRVRWYTAGAC